MRRPFLADTVLVCLTTLHVERGLPAPAVLRPPNCRARSLQDVCCAVAVGDAGVSPLIEPGQARSL